MRVVQVLGGAEDGGLEKHTIELSDCLHKESIDVSVIAHKKFRNDFKNIHFIELDLSKGRNNPFVLYKLYKILQKENFDIIHTQANKATDMVMKLKPYLKSKIVSTLHSYKKNIKSFEKADLVITVSDRIGEKIKNKNKITIYNGIKPESIQKINLYEYFNIPQNQFILCAVGRLSHVKRFDVLIKSLTYLNNSHLILVGSGECEQKLKQIAKNSHVNEKITFAGNLTNQKTKEVITSSKLFVITSDKEGFPYTFIETLFCETPVISTDVSDIKKLITNKYIVPFNNPQKLGEKINSIIKDYQIIANDFQSIFDFSKQEFTIDTMVKKTLFAYKGLLRK